NHITGSFLYTNLKSFSLKGQIDGSIEDNKILVKELFLDSKSFSIRAEGVLGKKKGNLKFYGQVKPIHKNNFRMEAVSFRGNTSLDLPHLYLTAYLEEPQIKVMEEEIKNLTGIIRGEGELFKSLVARGSFANEELELHVEYRIIPDNHLSFSYRNLRLTEKVFKLKEKVNVALDGEGELLFKERKLRVEGRSGSILVGNTSFSKGRFEFDYAFSGEGKLTAELSDPGSVKLNVVLQKKDIHGEAVVEDFPFSSKGISGRIFGKATFNKTKNSMYTEFSGSIKSLSYQSVEFPVLSFNGSFKNSQLSVNVVGNGVRAQVFGEPKDLNIALLFNKFRLNHPTGRLTLSSGAFKFHVQEKAIKGRGKFTDLRILYRGLEVITSGKLSLEKTEHLSLNLTGKLSAFYGDKVIDKSLKYAFGVKGNLVDLKGVSKRTKLRLNYRVDKRVGSFGGEYTTKKVFTSFWGRVKDQKLLAEGRVRLKLLGDYIRLSGSLKAEKEYAVLKLKPYAYKGKMMSYKFKGLQIVRDKYKLSVLFGGLETRFLRRPMLTISEAQGSGTLKRLEFSPIRLKGLVNGELRLGFMEEIFVHSKGTVDLTLLSKNMASLIKSEIDGKVDYEFWMRGKDFRLVATTEEAAKIRSAYFYEPFIGAINLEVEPNSLMFGMVNWFKNGYLNAYAITKDYKNFDINFMFEKAPVKYYTEELKVALLADGKGKVGIRNFKKINLELSTAFDGTVRVLKIPEAKEKKETKLPVELTMDAEFKTKTGLNVKLPEGRLLTALNGRVYGRYPEINYDILVQVKSGKVSYFGKDFIVKGGKLELHKREEEEERYVDLELNTWEEPYKIFLKVKGELDNPEVYYFSEPPLSRREILLKLIGGGGNNAVLPVATALSTELEQVGAFKGTLERLFDVKIGIGIQTSPTGELGAVIDLKKRISRLFGIKYRLSTLKDKRATYWELEARPPVDVDVGFHFFLYSDETREYRLRYRREFNF
ncbi:translocation/assembly module TamB domain-containing protein, partial [Aquifex sp.]